MQDLAWEDNLLERKTENDLRDVLKTLVGFANSVKPGHTAVLLIGERDDGTVQGVSNPDNIQRKVQDDAKKVYPAIVSRSRVYEKEGKICIRVEVEHSGNGPHFGGPAWIRKGSSTVEASDEIFQTIVNLRSSMVFELSKWLEKEVTVHGDETNVPSARTRTTHMVGHKMYYSHRWHHRETAVLKLVNNFWVTLETREGSPTSGNGYQVFTRSEPLSKLDLSFDDENRRLKIIVQY